MAGMAEHAVQRTRDFSEEGMLRHTLDWFAPGVAAVRADR
jgi:hypothetical protein